jgi:tight adherence protein C
VLALLSKNKYDEFLADVDKSQYKLKKYMPIIMAAMNLASYKLDTKYDVLLSKKLLEIEYSKSPMKRAKIYRINQVTTALFSIFLLSFIGACSELKDMMHNHSYVVDTSFLIFTFMIGALVFYLLENQVNEKLKKRRLNIQCDFPDFLNKLILLINAGMVISRAWERIVLSDTKNSPLSKELRFTLSEIKSGKPENKAYEDFAKRCRIPEITKFTSVVIQNLKKGNAELVSILRLQAVECWEMRKNAAKKLGEEASTKLIFPLMIMFIGILIIVLTPAVMQLGI